MDTDIVKQTISKESLSLAQYCYCIKLYILVNEGEVEILSKIYNNELLKYIKKYLIN